MNNELYHHGIKGQQWGKRRYQNKDGSLTPAGEKRYEKLTGKAEKKIAKAGRKLGAADYERSKGAEAMKKHETNAKVFDKIAKKQESEGHFLRAEAARKAAAALRARGANIKSGHEAEAKRYEIKAEKLKQKASDFATAKRVEVGKKRVDSILKSNRQKGFEDAKSSDEFWQERELHDRLGDDGYDAYTQIRGR